MNLIKSSANLKLAIIFTALTVLFAISDASSPSFLFSFITKIAALISMYYYVKSVFDIVKFGAKSAFGKKVNPEDKIENKKPEVKAKSTFTKPMPTKKVEPTLEQDDYMYSDAYYANLDRDLDVNDSLPESAAEINAKRNKKEVFVYDCV